MGEMIFYAHSGVRFLVLLAAVVAAAVLLWKWSSGRPFDRQSKAVTKAFTGLLDLQVTLGIINIFFRPWYGGLMGHLVMMLAAAFAAHGITVYGSKLADPRRAHLVALIGVVLALLLIIGGIMAIRDSPFSMTSTSAG